MSKSMILAFKMDARRPSWIQPTLFLCMGILPHTQFGNSSLYDGYENFPRKLITSTDDGWTTLECNSPTGSSNQVG